MGPSSEKIMMMALRLARLGGSAVAPNPMVGAVIIKNGRIIGKGYHRQFGGPHAEIEAIASVRKPTDLQGSTLYVTLEPCRHQGKTPPCSEAIIRAGIAKVIYGCPDPFQKKRSNQVPDSQTLIKSASLRRQCREINKFFFMWVEKGRPWLTVKVAMSADGFVAAENGQAVRMTSAIQDKKVHRLRASHQAIMVGINTVINDDPKLDVRHIEGDDPLRIVLDSNFRIPLAAKVLKDSNVFIATTVDTTWTGCPKDVKNKADTLLKNGIKIWKSSSGRQINLKKLLVHLASINISSVLIEPGPTLYATLKKEGMVDELVVLRGRKKLRKGLKIRL